MILHTKVYVCVHVWKKKDVLKFVNSNSGWWVLGYYFLRVVF